MASSWIKKTRLTDSVFTLQKPLLWSEAVIYTTTALKPRAMNESIRHKTVLMNKTRIKTQARDSAVAWSCHSTHRSTHFSLFTVLCLLFRRLSPCHCICTHHISCLLARFVWEPGPLCRPRASCWVSRLRCCHFAPRTKPDKGTLNFNQTRHACIKAPEPQEIYFYYTRHRLDEPLQQGHSTHRMLLHSISPVLCRAYLK